MGSGRLPTIPSAGAAQAAGGSGARGAPAFVSFNSSGLGGGGGFLLFYTFPFFSLLLPPFFSDAFFFLSFPSFPPSLSPLFPSGFGNRERRGSCTRCCARTPRPHRGRTRLIAGGGPASLRPRARSAVFLA